MITGPFVHNVDASMCSSVIPVDVEHSPETVEPSSAVKRERWALLEAPSQIFEAQITQQYLLSLTTVGTGGVACIITAVAPAVVGSGAAVRTIERGVFALPWIVGPVLKKRRHVAVDGVAIQRQNLPSPAVARPCQLAVAQRAEQRVIDLARLTDGNASHVVTVVAVVSVQHNLLQSVAKVTWIRVAQLVAKSRLARVKRIRNGAPQSGRPHFSVVNEQHACDRVCCRGTKRHAERALSVVWLYSSLGEPRPV